MSDKVQAINLLLGGGVGAIIIEGIRAIRQRKKMDADAVHVLSETTVLLLGPLQKRIAELEEQVKAARNEADELRHELLQTRVELDETRGAVRKMRDDVRRDPRGH